MAKHRKAIPKELRCGVGDSSATRASKRFWRLVVKIEQEKNGQAPQ